MQKLSNLFEFGDEKVKGKIRIVCLTVSSILLIMFTFQLWLHIKSSSLTFDEPLHILAGYQYWHCRNYALNPEHPPLLKLLATLPISLENLQEPDLACREKINYKLEGFIDGAQFMARNDIDQISTRTRLAASLMSLILAVLVFLAAHEMFGLMEAMIALALFAFEPILVAHGSLVTTDMAISATAFASVYALYRYFKRPGIGRLLITALAIGCMMAAKHTALLMLPLLFLLAVSDACLFRRRSDEQQKETINAGRRVLKNIGAYALMGLLALGVLWASYGFQYHALPEGSPNTISLADVFNMGFDHEAINSAAGQVVQIIHASHIVPEAYTLGLADVIGSGSRPMFLLGKEYPSGRWFYFPVAFTIKSSAVLLVLLFISLFYFPLYKKHPRELLFLLVPAAGYLAFSLTAGLNIGVRHILPIYPFLIIVAASGATALVRRYHKLIFVLIILLVFHFVEGARTAPDYIAFANVFWGGSDNAYHLLGDSNVEWSQNFKLIGEYVERNKVQNCYLSALGLGEVLSRYQNCHVMPGGFVLNSPGQINETIPDTIEGTVFISTASITPVISPEFEPFFKMPPVAILGGSILVFEGRFEIPALAARSHLERSAQLITLKRFDEAAADAQAAVRLMPHNLGAHLALGIALMKANQIAEARQELIETIRLTQTELIHDESMKLSAEKILEQLH